MTKRFILAAIGVILLSGGATAVIALNEVGKVVEALGQTKAVRLAPKTLASTTAGSPETLLLVGDDRRPPPKSNPGGFVVPHSNEMLLVRIDPSKPTISMLSIPRELQVPIYPPGGQTVVNRINVAYTIGGIQLMTETIKQVLGVSVNHVFVVTFPKFKRAVDEMGCVYMTVDRRYYHVNEPGGEQYFEINLQPGYQRLCGQEALEFVANRHEDTSLTRDARDQRFLLEVKSQYGATLFENREKFERILGKAVETDLHGTAQVLDLLELLVQSQGKPVRQVPFHVNLLPTFDTATPEQIQEAVQSFLSGTAAIPTQKLSQAVRAVHSHHKGPEPAPNLTPSSSALLTRARQAAPSLPFALEYPRLSHTFPAAAPETLRMYDIRDQQGRLQPAYAIVVNSGPLGEYYDVQGTSWTDPPLLSNPSQAVHAGSRTYELFYEGEQVRLIAWHEGNAAYWIQNTLTNSIPPREMLALAEQTVPAVENAASSPPSVTSVRRVRLPPRAVKPTSTSAKLAAGLSFVSLAAIAMLALLYIVRRRELRRLREQVTQAISLEARQRTVLASAGAGASIPLAEPAPTIYRVPRRWRRTIIAAGCVALVALVAAAAAHFLSSGSSSSSASSRHAAVPVAVFNASGNANEARSLVATLRADRIHLGAVGNINASLGSGVYVFYPPGAEPRARRVAAVIANLSPTVAPIQPQVQNAVGGRNEIVVIFD